MKEQFIRTALLLGEEAIDRLQSCRVAVFGIGGVGGHAAEALVRAGIGTIDLVDHDTVCLSNLNRQLIALHSTIGKYKTEAMKERLLDIDPQVRVNEFRCFFLPEEADRFPFGEYDYVVDAVDTVTAKIGLIIAANAAGVPVISSMGAGNKLNPAMLEVADIYDTSVCPLAKVMRRELKKRGVRKLKCVYSKELALTPDRYPQEETQEATQEPKSCRRSTPGSVSFVPSVAGLIIAGEVIKDLTGIRNDRTGV